MYAYVIFGIYAFTISPFIITFFEYGEPNVFIGVFGLTMIVLESFAIHYKLKIVRMRAEEKRIEHKSLTGIEVLPSAGKGIMFGLFMRLIFRMGIVMLSLAALGIFSHVNPESTTTGLFALIIFFFVDVYAFAQIYIKSGIYTDPPVRKEEWNVMVDNANKWMKENYRLSSSKAQYWKELLSDIVLQIYAVMLFTAFWSYINQLGNDIVKNSILESEPLSVAAMKLLPMLISMIILGLIPMRIAYWIEDSLMTFSEKEKYNTWMVFCIACMFTCVPAVLGLITAYSYSARNFISGISAGTLNLILITLFALTIIFFQAIIHRIKINQFQNRSGND